MPGFPVMSATPGLALSDLVAHIIHTLYNKALLNYQHGVSEVAVGVWRGG